jgi:hypothetical protein
VFFKCFCHCHQTYVQRVGTFTNFVHLLYLKLKSELTVKLPLVFFDSDTMEVLELKREIETLSHRLGKTQDYL